MHVIFTSVRLHRCQHASCCRHLTGYDTLLQNILRIIEEVRTAVDTADVINQLHSNLLVSQCHRYEQGELIERKPPPKQL